MYIPQADTPNSTIMPPLPLSKPPRFSLDMAGVLGLLGGDDAVSAMATVHLYGNRRWLGWYNTPGSLQISKRLSAFAKSASLHRSPKFLSGSENAHTNPMMLFKSDACNGPMFRAAHSGTVIEETSYLAALFMKECAAWDTEGKVITGRKTQPVEITIADLGQAPASEMRPARSSVLTPLFASIPIAVSVGTCALCALCEDWYASSLILVGIIASGVCCLVLGSADFVFTHPVPAKGSPTGDGILTSDKDIVLLRGTEGAVNSITRGRFSLYFSSKRHYSLVRWCSVLFSIQCIIQLVLIPQASLLGQVMFLSSFGVSALYNARFSFVDCGEMIHRKLLFERVLDNPRLARYTLGTRTAAIVFILLVLQLQDPTALLSELLPNDTKVWRQWKATVSEWLRHANEPSFQFGGKVRDLSGFTQQERDLLELLYEDARAAYDGYKDCLSIDLL